MGIAESKWQREEVPEHKFSYVNVNEYRLHSAASKAGYALVFLGSMYRIVVYLADIATAVLIIIGELWLQVEREAGTKTIFKSELFTFLRTYGAAIYLASFFASYIILAIDINRSIKIVRTGDISFAFTDEYASRFYSLAAYGYHCFFRLIEEQFVFSDHVILFVYFRLKEWWKLILAETPRQLVNLALLNSLLYRMYRNAEQAKMQQSGQSGAGAEPTGEDFDARLMFEYIVRNPRPQENPRFFLLVFVFSMYVLSTAKTLVAVALSVALTLRIRGGNIAEYLCHKVDKRIGELLRSKAQARIYHQQQALMHLDETGAGPRAELPVFNSVVVDV